MCCRTEVFRFSPRRNKQQEQRLSANDSKQNTGRPFVPASLYGNVWIIKKTLLARPILCVERWPTYSVCFHSRFQCHDQKWPTDRNAEHWPRSHLHSSLTWAPFLRLGDPLGRTVCTRPKVTWPGDDFRFPGGMGWPSSWAFNKEASELKWSMYSFAKFKLMFPTLNLSWCLIPRRWI